jgi:hypothetical protein
VLLGAGKDSGVEWRTATVSGTGTGTGTTDYLYYADGTRAEKIAPGNLTSQFYSMGGQQRL